MSPQFTLKMVTICDAYFSCEEFAELASLFHVKLDSLSTLDGRAWLTVCKEVATSLEHGNTRTFVDSVLDLAESRNADGIAHQTWERRDFHLKMTPVLTAARELLAESSTPSDISVGAGLAFTAKSKVRELVAAATSDLFVVDPYVGLGTLDCLRDVTVPIRILTADRPQASEADFDRNLAAFAGEGHDVTVRRAGALHDRHIVFNDRCWLVGSSLKDAGKKAFNCIEIVDKSPVVYDLEAKWQAAQAYP